MLWEYALMFAIGAATLAGIGVSLLALNKVNKIADTGELYEAINRLTNRPYVEPDQIKALVLAITKLDNMTTQQGQILATVKKSAFQAEEMSKKLIVAYNLQDEE